MLKQEQHLCLEHQTRFCDRVRVRETERHTMCNYIIQMGATKTPFGLGYKANYIVNGLGQLPFDILENFPKSSLSKRQCEYGHYRPLFYTPYNGHVQLRSGI